MHSKLHNFLLDVDLFVVSFKCIIRSLHFQVEHGGGILAAVGLRRRCRWRGRGRPRGGGAVRHLGVVADVDAGVEVQVGGTSHGHAHISDAHKVLVTVIGVGPEDHKAVGSRGRAYHMDVIVICVLAHDRDLDLGLDGGHVVLVVLGGRGGLRLRRGRPRGRHTICVPWVVANVEARVKIEASGTALSDANCSLAHEKQRAVVRMGHKNHQPIL